MHGQVQANGQHASVTVPMDGKPGQTLRVEIPDPIPIVVATAVAVPVGGEIGTMASYDTAPGTIEIPRNPDYSYGPVNMRCHACGYLGKSRVELKNGTGVVLCTVGGCCLCGPFGLAGLCLEELKGGAMLHLFAPIEPISVLIGPPFASSDKVHTCPQCGFFKAKHEGGLCGIE